MSAARPLPVATVDSAPFWEYARNGELRVQRCDDCGHLRLPPGPVCPQCWSTQATWTRTSGRGRVQSWVVYRRPYLEAFEVPYAVVLVELEEGPRYEANLFDCEPEAIVAGMPVEVVFVTEGDVVLPQFRPEGGAT